MWPNSYNKTRPSPLSITLSGRDGGFGPRPGSVMLGRRSAALTPDGYRYARPPTKEVAPRKLGKLLFGDGIVGW